jgi:hypothetical protein
MVTSTPRDPWRIVWQVATGDGLLVILLLAAAAGLMATAWLSQAPAADPAAYARWLSETQARFGKTTQTMQTLGLFTVAHSLGFRTLLALLAGVLLLRLVERGERLFSEVGRRLWVDLFPFLAHGGSLLLLAGLLLTRLWGWQVEGLIAQNGERTPVPGTESWVALDKDALRVTHSPGIVAFAEAYGPGMRVGAVDGSGNPLVLQRTAETEQLTELTLALVEDRYFVIPDAQLVVQLTPQIGHSVEAHSPVLIQVYRSPPGRLETKTIIEGDTELKIGDVTLSFASAPYARVTATFNPGLWPCGTGIALTIVGLVGSVARSARQPRTDEED